jgi:uncharacterized membrane protein YqiK
MRRSVSPLFAVIVIVVVVVLGGLWFMVRYRTHEAREAAISQMMRERRRRAERSGRGGMPETRRVSRGAQQPSSPGRSEAGEEDTTTGGESAGE